MLPLGLGLGLALVAALAAAAGCPARERPATGAPADGKKEGRGTMDYATTALWVGSGPSGGTPGLTVIHDAPAWSRVRASLGAEYAAKLAAVAPDWESSVLLFARSGATSPETRLEIARLSRAGDVTTVELALVVDSPGGMTLPTIVQPWLFAAAPREAFTGDSAVRLSSGGSVATDAVTHERGP